MTFTSGYQLAEAQTLMTLSTFAYLKESSNEYSTIQKAITQYLSGRKGTYATGTDWQLAWLGLSPDFNNLMYLAQNTTESNLFAIVVRGTDWDDLDDIIEDIDVFHTTVYPYSSPQDPSILISNGINDGLQTLISILGNSAQDGESITFPGFLATEKFTSLLDSSNSTINYFITGHSLGGALATIFTSWMMDVFPTKNFPQLNFKTYTFASPSVGNQNYVNYYDNQTNTANVSYGSYRVYNEEDIVPNFCASVAAIPANGIPVSPDVKQELIDIAGIITGTLTKMKVSYEQAGNDTGLPNTSPNNDCPNPASTLDCYGCWLSYEHCCNTYLSLLGAPTVPDDSSKSIDYRN